MEQNLTVRGSGGKVLVAVALSLLTTMLFGGMLYYTLKRYEAAQARQVEQVEQAGREQQAVAAGRLFARAGSAVVRTDSAKIQPMLQGGFPTKHLLDAAIVNQDDIIVAAMDSSRIGQRIQDPLLASQRATKREAVAGGADAAGKRTFTVLEPLVDNDGVVAWAWFRFGWPAESGHLRAPADRMVECARLMVPFFISMLLCIGIGMWSATNALRRQLRTVLTSVLDTPALDQPDDLRKTG